MTNVIVEKQHNRDVEKDGDGDGDTNQDAVDETKEKEVSGSQEDAHDINENDGNKNENVNLEGNKEGTSAPGLVDVGVGKTTLEMWMMISGLKCVTRRLIN
ncbi:uncharacterized protein [Nicotiana tomentosiformis]|uniref:uncharacterized protein isoform X4 n=1 Tax=Nicotiana tomentosiformis TaxID=4098 RepID=UPI00388C7AF2